MSKYIAKAYVMLKNKGNRRAVINSLTLSDRQQLGYGVYDKYIVIQGDGTWLTHNTKVNNYIDCNSYTPNGTEEEAVRLFLELAQMRDDSNKNQWFESKEPHGNHYWSSLFKYDESQGRHALFRSRRLTPLEVAQAFKDGRIEL